MKKLLWILVVLLAIACVAAWFRPHEPLSAEIRTETKIKTVVKVSPIRVVSSGTKRHNTAIGAEISIVSTLTTVFIFVSTRTSAGGCSCGRNPRKLFDMIKIARFDFIEDICKKRPANNKFKRGWMNRINDLRFEE